jgi:hypothetical protein
MAPVLSRFEQEYSVHKALKDIAPNTYSKEFIDALLALEEAILRAECILPNSAKSHGKKVDCLVRIVDAIVSASLNLSMNAY